MQIDLSKYNAKNYTYGPTWKILFWFFLNYYFLNSSFPWPLVMKRGILRAFGAKLGKSVVIKPKVRIKYPWFLTIGDYSWIGESVWIDNLEKVFIGNNVCISQGAMLLTGNHDYTVSSFPNRLDKIVIEDGVWIGAKSVVCPGVVCRSHSILTVNSVATKDLEKMKIYSGNPAAPTRERVIKNK